MKSSTKKYFNSDKKFNKRIKKQSAGDSPYALPTGSQTTTMQALGNQGEALQQLEESQTQQQGLLQQEQIQQMQENQQREQEKTTAVATAVPAALSTAGQVSSEAAKQIAKLGVEGAKVAGKGFAKTSTAVAPIALAATLAGEGIKYFSADDDDTKYNAGEIGGGLLSGAGQGASYGALAGSFIPGLGNVVGAGIGATIGAGISGAKMLINRRNAREEQELEDNIKNRREENFALKNTDLFNQATGVQGRDLGYNIGSSAANSYLPGFQRAEAGGKKVPGGVIKPLPFGAVEFKGNKHGQSGKGSSSGIILEEGGKSSPGVEVEDKETMDPKVKFADGREDDYIFSSYLKLGGKSFAQMHKEILQSGRDQEQIQNLAKMQEEKAKQVKKTPVGPTDQYGPRGQEYIAKYGGVRKKFQASMGPIAGRQSNYNSSMVRPIEEVAAYHKAMGKDSFWYKFKPYDIKDFFKDEVVEFPKTVLELDSAKYSVPLNIPQPTPQPKQYGGRMKAQSSINYQPVYEGTPQSNLLEVLSNISSEGTLQTKNRSGNVFPESIYPKEIVNTVRVQRNDLGEAAVKNLAYKRYVDQKIKCEQGDAKACYSVGRELRSEDPTAYEDFVQNEKELLETSFYLDPEFLQTARKRVAPMEKAESIPTPKSLPNQSGGSNQLRGLAPTNFATVPPPLPLNWRKYITQYTPQTPATQPEAANNEIIPTAQPFDFSTVQNILDQVGTGEFTDGAGFTQAEMEEQNRQAKTAADNVATAEPSTTTTTAASTSTGQGLTPENTLNLPPGMAWFDNGDGTWSIIPSVSVGEAEVATKRNRPPLFPNLPYEEEKAMEQIENVDRSSLGKELPTLTPPRIRDVPPLAYLGTAAQMIGPLMALNTKYPDDIRKISAGMQGKERLGKVNFNAERAANLNSSTATNNFIQNTNAGPAAIAAMMASNDKARQQSMEIASQEARQNMQLSNAEKQINANIVAQNLARDVQAQGFNAEASNEIDRLEYEKRIQAFDTLGAVGGQFARDVLEYKAGEREARANQIAGEYSRNQYVEAMQNRPKYRKMLKEAGVDPKDTRTVQRIAAAMYNPNMTLEEQEEMFREILLKMEENKKKKDETDEKRYGGYIGKYGSVKSKAKK
jgi:hypothetical protein